MKNSTKVNRRSSKNLSEDLTTKEASSYIHEGGQESTRIGFYMLHDYYWAMLEPVYSILKDEFPCLMTKNLNSIVSFKPRILLIADSRYYLYRSRLPGTIIIWVEHGFVSKNALGRAVIGADFACVSSEWLRDEYIRRSWNPRLGYWVTGFVSMDGVLNPDKSQKKVTLPEDFSKGKATLLYAPTWNKFLNSVEILGDKWIDKLRESLPDINVIIKLHHRIPKLFPHFMAMWRESARRNERTLLVEDSKSDIHEYLSSADILLSDASTVIFHFLALDRPVILINNPLRFKDKEYFDPEGPEWAWRDLGIQINHVDELPGALIRSLGNPGEKAKERACYRDRIFGNLLDGRASERIADKVRALINPKPEDKEWVTASWNSIALRKPVGKKKSIVGYIRALLLPLDYFFDHYPRLKYLLKRIFFFLEY